ncbi:MAG: hypothetical protein ACLPV4_15635 [Solirubrobacteraceae bacterium]
MTPINSIMASEHVADLRRMADRQRLVTTPSAAEPASLYQTIALRIAQPDEDVLVARLAALDDAPALERPVLLAVADGEPIAALSLADGRVVANPFVATAHAVTLLRVREQHLRDAAPRRGWRAILHPRVALR